MRRLFDSQDILSTLGRRLDGYIHRGLFEPRSEGELWSLVITIAERSVAEKARIWQALSENESGLARESAGRLESGVSLSGEDLMADGEFDHLLQQIELEEDRQIARHWALGHSSEFIAGELGLTPELVRQRWRRIREWLRGQLAEVAE